MDELRFINFSLLTCKKDNLVAANIVKIVIQSNGWSFFEKVGDVFCFFELEK